MKTLLPSANRPRRHRLALLVRLLLLLGVPAVYLLLTAAGLSVGKGSTATPRISETGRHLLWQGSNCTPPAILEFPSDLFTSEQRRAGAAALHAVLACYLFALLAIVCDDYFVPAIKLLCDKLEMTEDVAGATFMAAATSSPELFINSVGTFITEGDIGVGTVVGSAVFNILAVPACCGLFAGKVVQLDWFPLTRDCIMYAVTVVLLIFTLLDGRVDWYEALLLVSLYILYISAMYFNTEVSSFAKGCCKRRQPYKKVPISQESDPLLKRDIQPVKYDPMCLDEDKIELHEEQKGEDDGEGGGLCQWPTDQSCGTQIWWLLSRPISLVLAATIPDCRLQRRRHLFPLTFVMCMLWIGTTSYMVAWMITVLGDTLEIPDSVMGITFLAAGTSVPEAVSSVIVTNQGHGSMGISNSIGSNTFDILLCLGLPWLIKAAFLPVVPGQHFVIINSRGLEYSAMQLLSTLLLLYVSFALNKFKLDRTIGVVCLLIYAGFLTFASLIELNYFFPVNLPTCAS